MISVIIPLFNKEATIRSSIESVLAQEYTDFELIVIDDGSTDSSLQKAQDVTDERIRIIQQPNGGPSKARNTGINAAKGEWILLLDADDELLPGALSTFAELTRRFSHADIFDAQARNVRKSTLQYNEAYIVKNNFKAKYRHETAIGADRTLFRRTLLLENPYREDIRRYEDEELHYRLLRNAVICISPATVAKVNTTSSAASHPRTNVHEDFFGHINLKAASFWELMCKYRFYLEERDHYPEKDALSYRFMRKRYDLLLCNLILR